MSRQQSEKAASKSTTSTTASSATLQAKRCRVENYLVIWVDGNIDPKNGDYQNTVKQLRSVVNEVNICTTTAECIEYLQENKEETTFVISSGAFGQQLVPDIHSMKKLDAIYIFCGNKKFHDEWAKDWTKIKGVYTSINPICEALQLAVKQCNQINTSISIIGANEGGSSGNLNQLEPTFMYSQIFKEILLEMEHDISAVKDLAIFCKTGQYNGNTKEEKIIDEFTATYQPSKAIWWYTRECFTYKMLNAALRNLNGDVIIRMGFFLCDVHRQIESLHKEQVSQYQGEVFIIYRGQGLPTSAFEKLSKSKGGLISFNNFLSTSTQRARSLDFAKDALLKPDTVGILFEMAIDPTISSTPFASIKEISFFKEEAEILFSMHTVFRIDDVRQLDSKLPLYQVYLTLTSDDDEQLRQLTECTRKEAAGPTGWIRLGNLLYKIAQFGKAEELYMALLEQTSDDKDRADLYHQLGVMKGGQGYYKEAISFYEKSIKTNLKILPEDHFSLATTYNSIGQAYQKMGDYSKALQFFEKSIEIAPHANNPSLATFYNSIGEVYREMGDYSKALQFYDKSLKIGEIVLPPNHPSLAITYNNIGLAYYEKGDYSKALQFYDKSLKVMEIALPPNHPLLASSYNNIGQVYDKMSDYSKALEFYDKSLKVMEIALPPTHPLFATSYNNIGEVYRNMGDYSKALEFYEKDLEISKKVLPLNHPDLGTSYNNIGSAYYGKDDYPKALQYLEKALEIWQQSLPSTHPSIKSVLDSIDVVKKMM